ncbi:MAG: hypothetical protein RI973_2173 [Bacteroidota bacterium]
MRGFSRPLLPAWAEGFAASRQCSFAIGALVLFLFASSLSAQTALDVPVTLQLENQQLSRALQLLSEQPQVRLSFSNASLPNEKKVAIRAVNQPLKLVLDELLEDTDLEYVLSGTQVLLIRKPEIQRAAHTLHGRIADFESGEHIAGAVVYDFMSGQGTYANEYGYFSLRMEEGTALLVFSNLGYTGDTIRLMVDSNYYLTVFLKPIFLAEVVVSSLADSVFMNSTPGKAEINMSQANRLASLGGEPDIMRLAGAFPGVQTGTDGFGGISVRGGNVDQNLFLLDGVPVYNALHGIGIYSIYNSSAVRSASILTGNIPASYGGRISSVWDVQTREGNEKEHRGQVELGTSSALLLLEGPLPGKKGAFFVSGRRALFDFYSEPISRKLRQEEGAEGYLSYYFYDLNAKANLRISDKDRLYFSCYNGKDFFRDNYDQYRWFQDTLSIISDREKVNWGNQIAALRWNHVFSEKLFANSILTYSRYFYNSADLIDVDLLSPDRGRIARDVLLLKYSSDVRDVAGKIDLDYLPGANHRIRFGIQGTSHRFQPGATSFDQATIIDSIQTDTLGKWNRSYLSSFEYDAYVQDEYKASSKLSLNLGLRLSGLFVNGAHHSVLQPRLLAQYAPSSRLSLHAAAGRHSQFLHLLTPTNIGLPKDLWVSATGRVPPQKAWHFSAGASRKFGTWVSMDVEAYFKSMENLIHFAGTTQERLNAVNWQNQVSVGEGKALGLEYMLRLESPRLGGWISYTLSSSTRRFGKAVNRGEAFAHRLDRRHNFNLQVLYKFNGKWDVNAAFTLASGTPFSFPLAQYELVQSPFGGAPTEILQKPVLIEALNAQRLPVYHKLDLGVNHYFKQRDTRHTVKLGVYNLYFRQNPLYYTIRDEFDEEGVLNRKVIQVSMLPFFPALRYILEFN